MADEITVTAANIRPMTGATHVSTVVVRAPAAGATITAGQPVYIDGANGTKPGQANSVATANIVGIAIKGAAIGEVVEVCAGGELTGFTALTPGTVYSLSEDVAGGIKADADLAAADRLCRLGIALTANVLFVQVYHEEVAHA